MSPTHLLSLASHDHHTSAPEWSQPPPSRLPAIVCGAHHLLGCLPSPCPSSWTPSPLHPSHLQRPPASWRLSSKVTSALKPSLMALADSELHSPSSTLWLRLCVLQLSIPIMVLHWIVSSSAVDTEFYSFFPTFYLPYNKVEPKGKRGTRHSKGASNSVKRKWKRTGNQVLGVLNTHTHTHTHTRFKTPATHRGIRHPCQKKNGHKFFDPSSSDSWVFPSPRI